MRLCALTFTYSHYTHTCKHVYQEFGLCWLLQPAICNSLSSSDASSTLVAASLIFQPLPKVTTQKKAKPNHSNNNFISVSGRKHTNTS